jgi:hypothetical protein
MIDQLRRKLTYANVVATLALFIALGGTSYAALQLTGRDVRDRSLAGRDLGSNSVGGRVIKESRLGVVPRAGNAARVGGLSAARLLVHCPRETVPVSDVCVEQNPRPPAPYTIAAGTCEAVDTPATPGRRLPSHDELMTAMGDNNIALATGGELTRNVSRSPTDLDSVEVLVMIDAAGHVALSPNTVAGAKAFRCVTDPLN